MNAAAGPGRTVLAESVDRAAALAGTRRAPALIVASDTPVLAVPPGRPPAAFIDALHRVKAAASAADARSALELAATISPDAPIDWYTDGTSPADGVPPAILGRVRVHRVAPAATLAVVSVQAAQDNDSLMARVVGRADDTRDVRVRVLADDGGQIAARDVRLPAGEAAVDVRLAVPSRSIPARLTAAAGNGVSAEVALHWPTPNGVAFRFGPVLFVRLVGELTGRTEAGPSVAAVDAVRDPTDARLATALARTETLPTTNVVDSKYTPSLFPITLAVTVLAFAVAVVEAALRGLKRIV